MGGRGRETRRGKWSYGAAWRKPRCCHTRARYPTQSVLEPKDAVRRAAGAHESLALVRRRLQALRGTAPRQVVECDEVLGRSPTLPALRCCQLYSRPAVAQSWTPQRSTSLASPGPGLSEAGASQDTAMTWKLPGPEPIRPGRPDMVRERNGDGVAASW